MKKLLSLLIALPLVAILMFSPLVFAGAGDIVIEGKYVEVPSNGMFYSASYFPDYNEADQGITGDGKSVKTYIDTIGTDNATLIFRHNSGAATTTYTFSTDETIPANINVVIEKGAILSCGAGVTLTINGPFDAGLYQVFSGAGSVEFGSGAIAQAYPEWWGAKEGINSSDAINAALNSNCPKIFFQNITYEGKILRIQDNTILEGDGVDSVIKFIQDGEALNCLFYISNKSNIIIRDIQFEGTTVADGFSEGRHLFRIYGGTDVLIEKCWFSGWQGDAISIGTIGDGVMYNERITIKDCYFNGIDKGNRQAITCINGTYINIENNYFVNTTDAAMPGAICLEPNLTDVAPKLKHILIKDNYFYNIGGVAAICILLRFDQNSLTYPFEDLIIDSNHFNAVNSVISISAYDTVPEDSFSHGFKITNNVAKNIKRPFSVVGVGDLLIAGNTFEDSTDMAILGSATYGCRDATIRDNLFSRVGSSLGGGGGQVLYIDSISGLTVDNNTFNDCGRSNGAQGFLVNFNSIAGAETTENIKIINNTSLNPNNLTTHSVVVGALRVVSNPCLNVFDNNSFSNLPKGTNFYKLLRHTFTSGDTTPSVMSAKMVNTFRFSNGVGTSVTTFDNGTEGQIIILHLDAHTTLVDGATLLLFNNVDLVGTINDIITLISLDGSIWKEVSRSVN